MNSPAMYKFALVLVGALTASLAQADFPCRPSPCVNSKAKSGACAAHADWIVEGMVAAVRNDVIPFGPDGKGRVWDGGRVELINPVVVKGTYELLYDRAILSGASFCYVATAKVPGEWLGKKIRAFGTSVPLFTPWGRAGVIAVELVDP